MSLSNLNAIFVLPLLLTTALAQPPTQNRAGLTGPAGPATAELGSLRSQDSRLSGLGDGPESHSMQLYQTVNIQDLNKVLQAAGYDTQIVGDDIRFQVNNVKTWVHLYNCDESHMCKSFAYRVAFNDQGFTSELLNEYNMKRRWTHVYLNANGGPCMDWDLFIDGGVTYQYLVRTSMMWRDLLGNFISSLARKTIQ